MVKYYCDYCGLFLKNSSPACRTQHDEGWKHKRRISEYYRSIIFQMAEQIRTQQGK